MSCQECEQIRKDSKIDSAMCTDCGNAYYQGKIDMAVDLMIMVANKSNTRDIIMERCNKEVARCRAVQFNFGIGEKKCK